MRMRAWLLVPLAIVILVVADASSPRFDPVFEGVPAAVSTSLLVMAVLAVIVGVFFATFSIPSEIESKVACTVRTKPLASAELVAGKVLGMSALLLAMLAVVAAGAYGYIRVRSTDIRAMAARRAEEARTWVAHPADLNAVEAIAKGGPLRTYHYFRPRDGPTYTIVQEAGTPESAGRKWVLGETNLKLVWDLRDTPVREWTASGAGEFRLQLAIRQPPPAETAKPRQIVVGLVPVGGPPGVEQTQERQPGAPVQRTQRYDLPASGELRIPIVSAQAAPSPGTLQVPPQGRIELQVYATGDGVLVGAGADSVRIAGPGGQVRAVQAEPRVDISVDHGRTWLVGRSQLPRQVATFRFDAVPPGALNQGDTAIEIGFALQSWGAATTPSAAEAVFIKPETDERLALQFTPEQYHPTLLYLDRAFWHGGPLEVRLQSLTDEDSLGLLPESVRVRTDGGPFVLNLAKATANVWLFGTVILAFGVLLSTRFMWFVSVLGGLTFLLLCFVRDFIQKDTVFADIAAWLGRHSAGWPQWLPWHSVVSHLCPPLPDLQAMLPGENVYMGEAMALADLGKVLAWTVIAVVVLVAVGAWLFRTREVAA
jgi:hypothetical protein